MKYVPGNLTGTVRAGTTGSSGSSLTLFSTGIRFLTVDSSQNVYVCDTYNNRVLSFPNGSTTGTMVAGNGTYGTSLNQLGYPYAVWVDSNSDLFIAEYQVHRVTKWVQGATSGTLVAGVNSSAGSTSNKLSSPSGLYYDEANQYLYIANSGSSGATIMRWRIGDSNGTVIAGVSGSPGSASNQLNNPMSLTFDQWNNLYVADRTNNRIQLFCNESTTGITIAGSGTSGSSLSAPYDVKLDPQMNLYVSENSGSRVSKFGKL